MSSPTDQTGTTASFSEPRLAGHVIALRSRYDWRMKQISQVFSAPGEQHRQVRFIPQAESFAEKKMKHFAILAAFGLTVLSGCATHSNPNTFNRSEVGRQQTVQAGSVTAVRAVTIQNDSRGVATATGAVLGGLAGNTVGGGRGRTAATVGGVVAGGAAGNAVAGTTRPGVEVTVQLDSGGTVAVVQEGTPDQFRAGDRVNVTSDGTTTRVSR